MVTPAQRGRDNLARAPLSVNGQPRGEPFAGEAFYGAILKIFIGPDPVDEKLKAGLLGQA